MGAGMVPMLCKQWPAQDTGCVRHKDDKAEAATAVFRDQWHRIYSMCQVSWRQGKQRSFRRWVKWPDFHYRGFICAYVWLICAMKCVHSTQVCMISGLVLYIDRTGDSFYAAFNTAVSKVLAVLCLGIRLKPSCSLSFFCFPLIVANKLLLLSFPTYIRAANGTILIIFCIFYFWFFLVNLWPNIIFWYWSIETIMWICEVSFGLPSSFLLYQKAPFIYSEDKHLKKSAENFQDEHVCVLVGRNKTCVYSAGNTHSISCCYAGGWGVLIYTNQA